MKTSTPMEALEKAVSICGTQAELARRVAEFKGNPKIKQAHVWNWLNREKEVPADCVIAVENATIERGENGQPIEGATPQVTRHDLHPDLYPREVKVAGAPTPRAATAAGTR